GGASTCARVHGTNCQHQPCPSGLVCDVAVPSQREGHVWMRCARPCDQHGATCPEGFVCLAERCRRLCEPEVASACGPEEVCLGLPTGGPRVCAFSM
ncbi:MAG TPA: hypothetical protein VLQ93_26255, partial [Myxococcaceae bacterium]|nr:hypothetical protein [Myxococcaceae bacterium]